MAALGHSHSEGRRSPEVPLVEILAEIVRSALELEAACLLESDPDFSLNQDATVIDYPPTDPQPAPLV